MLRDEDFGGLRSNGGILGLVKSRLFAHQAGKTTTLNHQKLGLVPTPMGAATPKTLQAFEDCTQYYVYIRAYIVCTTTDSVPVEVSNIGFFFIFLHFLCISSVKTHEVFFPNTGELEFGECALLVKSSRLEPEKNHTWT